MDSILIREMKSMNEELYEADIHEKMEIIERTQANIETILKSTRSHSTAELAAALLPILFFMKWSMEGFLEYGEYIEGFKEDIQGLKRKTH